jgi:voltage-gated potassium channel
LRGRAAKLVGWRRRRTKDRSVGSRGEARLRAGQSTRASDRSLASIIFARLRGPLLAFVAVFLSATAGYVLIEGFGWLDGAYMTMITLSTVGYGEVHLLDSAGRVFTMAVIAAGFTIFLYAASVLTAFFTSGEAGVQLNEQRDRRMRDALDNHVIVVGFGRVGQAVVRGLREYGGRCLVLDRNPGYAEMIQAAGAVALVGDATNEAELEAAGISRAAALVAATEEDNINLIIVLTARALRQDLRIVSRVNEASWLQRIQRAGADVVESPYQSYGMSLAASAVSPAVFDLHDLPLLGFSVEEIALPTSSSAVGRAISDVANAHPTVRIVGVRRNKELRPWYEVDGPLAGGDVVVALGAPEHLVRLSHTLTTK